MQDSDLAEDLQPGVSLGLNPSPTHGTLDSYLTAQLYLLFNIFEEYVEELYYASLFPSLKLG